MVAQLDSPLMSPQEYLRWELEQLDNYGYIDGHAYAMAGGTLAHNRVAVNLTALLNPYLRAKQCVTYSGDAKVGMTEKGPFHCPAVSVTCDARDRAAQYYIRYPCLIVEVLSNSTEAFDRGRKFERYRRIETLREYVLINSEKMSVECYRLNNDEKWELTHYYINSFNGKESCRVDLNSVGLSFPIDALYENITFPENE